MNKTEVSYVKREIIEDKLLVALSEEGKVAILLTKEDLDFLSDALRAYQSCLATPPYGSSATIQKTIEWLDDLKKLGKVFE